MNRLSERDKSRLWDVIWENSISGLAVVAEDGTFVRANPAFCKIVEYSEYELQNMKFHDITVPSDVDIDATLAKEVQAGERVSYDLIKSYITKTRRIAFVHLRVFSVRGEDGTFTYFLSQVFEIPSTVASQMENAKAIISAQANKSSIPAIAWGDILKFWPIALFAVSSIVAAIGYVLGQLGG